MPAQPNTENAEAVYDLTAASIPPGEKAILLLEDDAAFSDMVRIFLESNGFQVTCVKNGVEGLKQLMARDFDVILCDMVMPNLPGDMFYLAVERTKKHLCKRFIFMTGHKRDSKYANFLSKVTGPTMEKPFLLAELLSTVETVITENALRLSQSDK